jgi:hypothetical protein
MQYSNQKFGIKGQAKIYRDLGGTEEYNEEVWDRFGDLIGWRLGGRWLEINEVAYHATNQSLDFTFPVLMYRRLVWSVFLMLSLLSRRDLKDCSI